MDNKMMRIYNNWWIVECWWFCTKWLYYSIATSEI